MNETVQGPVEPGSLEIRYNHRWARLWYLAMVVMFLLAVAYAVFTSGNARRLGIGEAVLLGAITVAGVATSELTLRRHPVAATLNQFGLTFAHHGPITWESLDEVHVSPLKPRLLFVVYPLHVIAFVPKRLEDVGPLTLRERQAVRQQGTPWALMVETLALSADDITAAVRNWSNVAIRR